VTDDPVGTRGGLTVAAAPETGEADAELAALIAPRFDALIETWLNHTTALGMVSFHQRLLAGEGGGPTMPGRLRGA
jgi:hypothetical protein